MATVYIAGPMSGRPAHGIPAFQEEAARQRALGHEVLSPVEKMDPATIAAAIAAGTDWQGGGDYKRLLLEDLTWIATRVDHVVLLPDWESSKGACAEVAMAAAMRIPIYASGAARIPFDSIRVSLALED